MSFTRRSVNMGLAAGLATSAFSPIARAGGDTIKIGMVASVTGPGADSGKYAVTGAKIALERVNKSGGALGKQVELLIEDDQTANPGAVLAFTKLAAQPDIVAFLGQIRSTQTHAMAPDILKTGKPVCFGGTDPALTKMGNPWLIRFRPNDSYSGRVIASYGVETLGKKNWAIVHSTDAFGTSGFKALSAALDKIGAKVLTDQGYPNQSQDLTPVVLAIKSSGADIIGSYSLENDLAILARQLRQLGVTLPWVGSASIVTRAALKLAGPALWVPTASPTTRSIRVPKRRNSPDSTPRFQKFSQTKTAPGPMMRSAFCARRSTRRARPTPARSATRSCPPRATRARRANTTSTSSATGCTDTTSCATRRGPSFSTSTSNSRTDRRTYP